MSDSTTELSHRFGAEVLLEKYKKPIWRQVLECMDVMDMKGWTSSNEVLNSAEWTTYHIPTQHEYYFFPNEDGSLSDHQKFYLESVKWVDKLADEIDITYLVNFPNRFGIGELIDLDPKMSQSINDVALLLTQTPDGDHSKLKFTLTDENYIKLDSPKKKLAAFLLLRSRLAARVGGAVSTLLSASEQTGSVNIGNRSLVEIFEDIKNRGGEVLREIDDEYFTATMGDARTIDWLDQIYHHPLLTNTNEVLTKNTNEVRNDFLKRISADNGIIEPEASPLGKLLNIAFEEVGLDDECPDFMSKRRKEGKPAKLSQKAKSWVKNFYEKVKAEGFTLDDIQVEINRLESRDKKSKNKNIQRLLLNSLRSRVRRDLEADLREEILETRGKWWQILGLTPFEINYLTEMELAKRRTRGVERFTKNITQLKKEIRVSLNEKIGKSRKWAQGRIVRRLKELE